jgi:alkanesulfonate monooxygenase SsuD/methylene tetrahydromethanopterin reductase-like flavin-dependent oxidoreductase (luciferase family)
VLFAVVGDLPDAQTYYRTIKRAAALCGRDPTRVKVLPGIVPIIGETEAAARRREQELTDLIVPSRAIAALEERLGVDLHNHDLDRPLPSLPPPDQFGGQQGRYRVIKELADQGLPMRQIL